jgi:glutamyl-tRNA synthetase
MKEYAKLKNLPPVYTGKWAYATDKEVEEELEKGTPYTFRFRVPKGSLKISDLIRGEVSSFHPLFSIFFPCFFSRRYN